MAKLLGWAGLQGRTILVVRTKHLGPFSPNSQLKNFVFNIMAILKECLKFDKRFVRILLIHSTQKTLKAKTNKFRRALPGEHINITTTVGFSDSGEGKEGQQYKQPPIGGVQCQFSIDASTDIRMHGMRR
jgi:hypothetical protein